MFTGITYTCVDKVTVVHYNPQRDSCTRYQDPRLSHTFGNETLFPSEKYVLVLCFRLMFNRTASYMPSHVLTKESSGANKIMRNAIDLTSMTFRWTSSSSRQSVFSTTLDGSKRWPSKLIKYSSKENGDQSESNVYLVKIGPKSLGDGR